MFEGQYLDSNFLQMSCLLLTSDYKCGLQISRSIGDVYLKRAEFNREPLLGRFRLREPFNKPILSSEPSISVQPLQPQDWFVIFASDGLWEHLTNQEAVDIVHNGPRSVCFLPQLPFYYFSN